MFDFFFFFFFFLLHPSLCSALPRWSLYGKLSGSDMSSDAPNRSSSDTESLQVVSLRVKYLNPQRKVNVEHLPWWHAAGHVEASPAIAASCGMWDRNEDKATSDLHQPVCLTVCCLLVRFIAQEEHCYTCRIHGDVWVKTFRNMSDR